MQMKLVGSMELVAIALLVTVASLTSADVEVKVQPDQHQGTLKGHGHGSQQKTAALESELRELRKSINKNRQNIASLQQREGQLEVTGEEVDDELTEVRPLDIPLHHHDPDDVTDYRLYATTTIRSFDVDFPSFEDEDSDEAVEEDVEHSGESPSQTDANTEPVKRSHVEGHDDNDDDDNDEDDDDDDDDDVGDDEVGEARKKKSDAEVTSQPTTRDELVRDLNVFLATPSVGTHTEALFQGVAKLKQIREIEKRVNLPLKEKYVNAVDPKADEDLLELMVKIAENPREWQNVHGVLQQLEEDLKASRDMIEEKRRDQEAKSKPNRLTKQQQAEKKKKKKKKQREKERLAKERQNKNKVAVKEKTPEELRREQLERAGLLAPAAPSRNNKQKVVRPPTTTTTTTTTTTRPPVTVAPRVTASLARERGKGQASKMKSVDLVKNQARVLLHEDDHPRPKSPMQELREKWPKTVSVGDKTSTVKSIVHGRLRSHEPNDPIRVAGTSNGPADSSDIANDWTNSNLGSGSREDKDRARARFLKETIELKSSGNRWQPNARSKWLETEPLPAKEQRADPNIYFNPSYDQPDNAWPDFSVESLKHGNVVKPWPMQQQVQSTWPRLPDDAEPDISVTQVDSSKASQWANNMAPQLPDKWSDTWPNTPQQKAPVKEAVSNKAWPHFAYHRVTSSPQTLARQQKEAQQRARHRNAYIAVSIIAPPGKNASDKLRNATRKLPDKMDDVLEERGHKQDPLEEQLVDMATYASGDRGNFRWNHSQHLDKLKEQLKTLSAMEEKLRLQWLEKERMRQILTDASRRGATYYREHRDAHQHSTTSPLTPAPHS